LHLTDRALHPGPDYTLYSVELTIGRWIGLASIFDAAKINFIKLFSLVPCFCPRPLHPSRKGHSIPPCPLPLSDSVGPTADILRRLTAVVSALIFPAAAGNKIFPHASAAIVIFFFLHDAVS